MYRREIGFENPFLVSFEHLPGFNLGKICARPSLQGRIRCIPELHVSASGRLNFGSLESLPLPRTPLHTFRVILEFTTWNEDGLVQGRKEHVQLMFGSLLAPNIGSCKCPIQRGSRRDLLNIFPNFRFSDGWKI